MWPDAEAVKTVAKTPAPIKTVMHKSPQGHHLTRIYGNKNISKKTHIKICCTAVVQRCCCYRTKGGEAKKEQRLCGAK